MRPIALFLRLTLALLALSLPLRAGPMVSEADIAAALRLPDVLSLMQAEGARYAAELEAELFPGKGGAAWEADVQALYAPGPQAEVIKKVLARELAAAPEAKAAAHAFFTTDPGQKIIGLELEARRTLLDPDAETAAAALWADLQESQPARAAQIERLVAAGDLVALNVQAALNGNLAFYRGLIAGGALPPMEESAMLAEVAGQEEAVRQDTEDWLYPFLALAYAPLSEEELAAYIAFSESPAGRQLNQAVFAGFDAVLTPLSEALGRAAAHYMQGQDI